ncbi:NUDIX domain-containing protein [Dactylosporangium fulvum]
MPVQTERLMPRIIVGAAIISDGRVLACERAQPPEMAGKWEFPGGKVDPGETEEQALVRECQEELGVEIEVGQRVGADISMLNGSAILRVYLATLVNRAQPVPLEHSDLRWLSHDELDSVPWLPADAPIVAALGPLLPSSA